jgi:hypothetical protein
MYRNGAPSHPTPPKETNQRKKYLNEDSPINIIIITTDNCGIKPTSIRQFRNMAVAAAWW